MLRGLVLLPYRLAVQALQQARLLTPLHPKLESIALPVGGLDESKAHGIVFALRQTATTPEVRRSPFAVCTTVLKTCCPYLNGIHPSLRPRPHHLLHMQEQEVADAWLLALMIEQATADR